MRVNSCDMQIDGTTVASRFLFFFPYSSNFLSTCLCTYIRARELHAFACAVLLCVWNVENPAERANEKNTAYSGQLLSITG